MQNQQRCAQTMVSETEGSSLPRLLLLYLIVWLCVVLLKMATALSACK